MAARFDTSGAAARAEHEALLRRILDLERRKGFRDDAVVGGLNRFLTNWLNRWDVAERNHADGIVRELAAYSEADVPLRRRLIDAALRRLDADPPTPRSDPPIVAAPSGSASSKPAEPNRDHVAKVSVVASSPPVSRAVTPGPAHAITTTEAPPRAKVVRRASPTPVASPYAVDEALAASVKELRGVGDSNVEKFGRLGVWTIRDLLYLFPRRHLDYRSARLIKDLTFEDYETILASVWSVKVEGKPGGVLIIRVIFTDESGTAEAMWIRRKDYLSRDFVTGHTVVLSGECRLVGGRPVFRDPDWESFAGEDTVHTARLVPVYPLVEGLNGRYVRRIAKQAIDRYASLLTDPLPTALRSAHRLLDLPSAIAQAHFPDSDELKASAQRRLAFDELLIIQLGLQARRSAREHGEPAPALAAHVERARAFLDTLPFQLTGAQQRALADIGRRLDSDQPMSLLLEGDVGSGKTVVAAAAMVQVAANGFQSAVMAPTEILAEQHHRTLTKLMLGLGEDAPKVALLTGSVKGAERRKRYAEIGSGEATIVVGTQALVQEGLEFAKLGLVVIDEQHRFGVVQRSTLRQKGYKPHVLVMTATPIPRTLALTVYGDLDLQRLDELPPGRQTIKTRHLRPTDRPRAYEFLRREVKAGHQAFVICPLVEETGRSEARAAVDEYERLQQDVFPDLKLGLVHGRMKPAEKDGAMRGFQGKEFDVLVSTSVVEVGIDIPNATVMLIEGANRFGLAQLHQFRGRVGRGDAQSYCLLISDTPSEVSDRRLDVVERTHDGFLLAEEDLKLRGPGEFFGTRQSGLPDLKMAKLSDVAILEEARQAAIGISASDLHLAEPEHRLLRDLVAQFWSRAERDPGLTA